MRILRAALALLAILAVLVSLAPARDARACAAVGRRGPIEIAGEEALIVWDARSRTQHFVRTAAFANASDDFGFLVPTPTRPELAEVDDAVFARLFDLYRAPEPVARGARGVVRGPATSAVEVLERRTVAGLDASVLAASDAGALDAWLARNGYPSGPALRAWLERYVRGRWIVTAFRIDPFEVGPSFATRAVRMSFTAERPFFPYSEPQHAGARQAGRPFRVSVVAPYRVRALEGERPWSARVGYAARPGARLARALRDIVPSRAVGPRAYLTVFDEPRSVRGADDLFFEPDPDQSAVASTIRARILTGH